MTELLSITPIEHTPLREITRQHGEAGLIARLNLEVDHTDWDGVTRQRIDFALDTALAAHKNVMRGDHPYSTHVLRVAIRIMSPDHFNIRHEPDLIIAALLHDTVENHPEYFIGEENMTDDPIENQRRALAVIEQLFGTEIAELVAAVTNPEFPSDIPRTEKYDLYRDHVVDTLVTRPKAAVIKLSDFIDNCVGLMHSESPEIAQRLAHKYQPLIPAMGVFVLTTPYFSPSVRDHATSQLQRGNRYCSELIAAVSS